MSRQLQHIAWSDDIEAAIREGRKVEGYCGAKVYPLLEMKSSIPTCTPCSTENMRKGRSRFNDGARTMLNHLQNAGLLEPSTADEIRAEIAATEADE